MVVQLAVSMKVPDQRRVCQKCPNPGDFLPVDGLGVKSEVHGDRFPPLVEGGGALSVELCRVLHFQPGGPHLWFRRSDWDLRSCDPGSHQPGYFLRRQHGC